jgi:signal transduction histidine kinase
MDMECDSMKTPWSMRRSLLTALAVCLGIAIGLIAWRALVPGPIRIHSYKDSFANGRTDEWIALGGTWELVNGEMRNDSDERGAKLMTGSPHWRNYSIEADISLLGQGDAGLIIRSSNEEEGVDAYSGYYSGIRTIDNSLVLGRAEHGWREVTKKASIDGGIEPFQKYHLKLLAYDCSIVSAITTPSHPSPESIGITDPRCVSSGRVGLRSYRSGGTWSNVVVRPASHNDLMAMLRIETDHGVRAPGSPPANNSGSSAQAPLSANPAPNAHVQSIESLRLAYLAQPAKATIRGVVILTSPMLFVQDSTGGVYVRQYHAPPLKVGDEIEVTGIVHPSELSSVIDDATVRVLWEGIPMAPVSVTATQASTGKFDATLIEVQGRLTAKERGPENTLILDLEEAGQSFRAIMHPGRGTYVFDRLKPDSRLNLRGICVVDPAFTSNLTPFVLLLRSGDDVSELAGPPWWSAGHLIALTAALLLLAAVSVFAYQWVENWRLRAVLDERERLAHEMHDTLAQSFAGIGFQLQAIRNNLPERESSLHQQLELASNLVRHSHEEARRSIAMLRPESLESEDLLSALDLHARRLVEGSAVRVISERTGEIRPIPLRIADTLFRVGQESIANSLRHAKPTMLRIRLDYGKNSACLEIEDDGTGFVPGNALQGFGIRGMRRRAQSVSAAFHLQSAPGEGTRISVTALLPPRITLATWPKLLWKHMTESWINGRASKFSNPHSYRG